MNILIVEDDAMIREGVMEFLSEHGYQMLAAADGEEGLHILQTASVHLALLDIMLPKMTGLQVLKELRSFSHIPVIMLTAMTDERSQIESFDKLADDYICKPFSLILLEKRMQALLRRHYGHTSIWHYKNTVVDFTGFSAACEGKDTGVVPKELKVLAYLLEHAGQVLTREQILDRIWGNDEVPFDRVVDVYIKNLRKKLQLDCIVTVKGVGYKLEL